MGAKYNDFNISFLVPVGPKSDENRKLWKTTGLEMSVAHPFLLHHLLAPITFASGRTSQPGQDFLGGGGGCADHGPYHWHTEAAIPFAFKTH